MNRKSINARFAVHRRSMVVIAALVFLAPLVWLGARAAATPNPDTQKPEHSDDAKAGGGDDKAKDAKGEPARGKKDEHKDEVKLTPEAVRRYGLRTGVARKHKLASSFIAPARVLLNAEATAVVGSAVQGRVAELKVRIGGHVDKGDLLLVVESPELGEAQSDFLQKRAALAGANAVIAPAKSAVERAKSLFEGTKGISLAELQKREVEYATAQNNLLVAQAAADAAQSKLSLLGLDEKAVEQLEKTHKINALYSIRAPISGVVTERLVTLGELVKPDREKLLVVADMTTLWVLADVPEARLKEVMDGAKATVTLGAVGEQAYEGTVSNISVSVDPATRSIPVRIEVKANPLIKPGMFAQVEITSRPAGEKGDEAVLAVPDAAVQTVEGSTAVFTPVKGELNTYAVRMVSIGPVVGGMAPIISGLEEGERIVTAGASILKADLGKASAKDD